MKMNAMADVDDTGPSVYNGSQTETCAGTMSASMPTRPQTQKKQKRALVSVLVRARKMTERMPKGISPMMARRNRLCPSANCRWAISRNDSTGAMLPTVISRRKITREGVTKPTTTMRFRHVRLNLSNCPSVSFILCIPNGELLSATDGDRKLGFRANGSYARPVGSEFPQAYPGRTFHLCRMIGDSPINTQYFSVFLG